MLDNYQVVFKQLPNQINAFTMFCASENYYTIVLNLNLTFESQQKAFRHEIEHIKNEDFSGYRNVGHLEKIRH